MSIEDSKSGQQPLLRANHDSVDTSLDRTCPFSWTSWPLSHLSILYGSGTSFVPGAETLSFLQAPSTPSYIVHIFRTIKSTKPLLFRCHPSSSRRRPSMAGPNLKTPSNSQSTSEKFHSQNRTSRLFHGIRQHLKDTKARNKLVQTEAATRQQQALSPSAPKGQFELPLNLSKVCDSEKAVAKFGPLTCSSGHMCVQLHLRAWLLRSIFSARQEWNHHKHVRRQLYGQESSSGR